MPLSLRRPERHPLPTATPEQSRSVSTPTLLSRLRNSTFSRSKASLLSSFAYESVRARTPPTPYSPSIKLPQFEVVKPKSRPRPDEWEKRGFKLTKEQRECLAGAECLGIWNPITGENGMSPSSVGLMVEMPHLIDSPLIASTDNHLDDISEIHAASESEPDISDTTPTNESFDHLSPKSARPAKLEDIFTPPSPPRVFTPYRKITLRSRVREAKARSTVGSPVMVPFRSDSPDPKTPIRTAESSPDWTPISVPLTPLAKMALQQYQ